MTSVSLKFVVNVSDNYKGKTPFICSIRCFLIDFYATKNTSSLVEFFGCWTSIPLIGQLKLRVTSTVVAFFKKIP